MLQTFLKALFILLILNVFMLPGYLLGKFKLVGKQGTLTLSNILLYVCQPALMINAFCVFSADDWQVIRQMNKLELLGDFAIVTVMSVLAMVCTAFLCKLIFIKSSNRAETNVLAFTAVFSNCGFVGLPFVQMLCGSDPKAVLYMVVFCAVFSVLSWTLGVYLITGDFKSVKIKSVLLNPTIIAVVVAAVVFFVPQINVFMFNETADLQILPKYLGNMSVPLSMIIVGIRLSDMPPKRIFANGKAYLSGVFKLVAAPLLTLALTLCAFSLIKYGFGFSDINKNIFYIVVIAMAMPPAALVVAMTEKFDGDSEFATAAFLNNTIFGIISIPLIITFSEFIFSLL